MLVTCICFPIYFEVCCFITNTQYAGQTSSTNDMPAPPKLLLQWGTVAPSFFSKVESNKATHVLCNLRKQGLDGQNLATGCPDGSL